MKTIDVGTTYFCGKVTDACLQEIILHRPLHQVVVNRAAADAFVVGDGLVVITFQGGQVRHLEVVLVCKAIFEVYVSQVVSSN